MSDRDLAARRLRRVTQCVACQAVEFGVVGVQFGAEEGAAF